MGPDQDVVSGHGWLCCWMLLGLMPDVQGTPRCPFVNCGMRQATLPLSETPRGSCDGLLGGGFSRPC
jgi:hypothetical protein